MQPDKPPRAASEPPNRIERYPCECDWHTRPSTRARSRCRATLARLVVRLLVGTDGAITVAIDDTLFTRRGPKVPPPRGSTTRRPEGTARSAAATTG